MNSSGVFEHIYIGLGDYDMLPKRSIVTWIHSATSEILSITINHSAWKKDLLPPKIYTAKGACLLLPGFLELEIANERGMEFLEIRVNNLMLAWKEGYKSSCNLKAIIISSVYIILVNHYIILQ